MSKQCVTHHFACDCREEKFKQLEQENAKLREKFMFAESEIILLREDREELRELVARMATEMREVDHEFALLRDYDAARKEAQP